jgi:hypothetical protein
LAGPEGNSCLQSLMRLCTGKGKVYPGTGHEGVEVYHYSFFNLGSRWGGRSTPHPGRFNPGKDKAPIVYEAGWARVQVWTGAENLALIGILSPGRPVRSELLY